MSTEETIANVGETDTDKPSIDSDSASSASRPMDTGSSGASAAVASQREDDEPRSSGEDFGQLLDQFEQEIVDVVRHAQHFEIQIDNAAIEHAQHQAFAKLRGQS